MTFHVGQKVVCVDTTGWDGRTRIFFDYPVKGEVYHVREIDADTDGLICIRVAEIKNRIGLSIDTKLDCEPMFRASRFRPVTELKTDISIFTKMLTPQGVDA